MIEAAPFLRPRFQRVVAQYQKFLDSVGAAAGQYSVGPRSGKGTILVAVYQPEDFNVYSYKTFVRITVDPDEINFTTSLDNALYFTAQLFEGQALVETFPTADRTMSDEAVLIQFGIGPEVMKPKIAGWATGIFIAPDGGGYACFSVDVHGEISIEARSANLAGVAFYFTVWQSAEASNLSARIGQFAPAS